MSDPFGFMRPDHVQQFLDSLTPGEPFVVKFAKQRTGEVREVQGTLDHNGGNVRKTAVPIQTEEGWKSFLVDRVYYIGRSRENA